MAKGETVPGLTAEDSLRDAAVKIIWTRFEEMWAFRDAVLKGEDIEAIHDMRVASRRLRTLMQTFRPCFSGQSYKKYYQCIQTLADELGAVRDRDVLIAELKDDVERLPGGDRAEVAGLIETLEAERKMHRKTLRARLKELERSGFDQTFIAYLARRAS